MEYSYCTLFDKNYLDKGLVLIESFRKYNVASKLYILALDEMCYKVLLSVREEGIIPVQQKEFETEELLKVKTERSRGEYCWTCAAHFIYFVLTHYQEEYCTYIDADMCFYDDPDKLVEEMIAYGKSVQIVEQRFRNGFEGRIREELSGKYCVEFNTFKRDEEGLHVLEVWKNQTLKECAAFSKSGNFGDQRYLEKWPEEYACVHVLQNIGAGLAPWNINRYRLSREGNGEIWITYDGGKSESRVVFFHYHDLKYIDKNKVNIGIHKRYWKLDMELTYLLYEKYLVDLQKKKEWIFREYGFYPMIQNDALGNEAKESFWVRMGKLFSGNIYKNFRLRLGNYLKIFLFQKYDIMSIDRK